MSYVRTLDQVAELLGLSVPSLCQYRKLYQAPIEKVPGKGYPVNRIRRWLEENHLPRKRYPGHYGEKCRPGKGGPLEEEGGAPASSPPVAASGGAPELQAGATTPGEAVRLRNLSAQARERIAKAEMREIELRQLRGEVIPIEEVKKRDVARIAIVKRGLLAFADSLPQHLEGLSVREMKAVIQHRVRSLLERFSKT